MSESAVFFSHAELIRSLRVNVRGLPDDWESNSTGSVRQLEQNSTGYLRADDFREFIYETAERVQVMEERLLSLFLLLERRFLR